MKKIWTSSFVLVAGGYSLWLLALLYWMIDMRQWRGWCRPLVWIGMNAITLYLANNLSSLRGSAPSRNGSRAASEGVFRHARDAGFWRRHDRDDRAGAGDLARVVPPRAKNLPAPW